MKSMTWPLAAMLMSLAAAAPARAADPVGYVAADGVNTVPVTSATPLPVTTAGQIGAGAAQVQGAAADGAATAGNPVLAGGQYLSSQPALASGQAGALLTDSRRRLQVLVCSPEASGTASNLCATVGVPSDGFGNADFRLSVSARTQLAGNSGQMYTARDVTNAIAVGTGDAAVALTPSAAAGAAIAPATSTAVASSQVLKAAAGNGYRYAVTTGASAGYFMVFDATALPANGAVTPKICRAAPANSSLEIDHSTAPDRFAAGIVEAFSTTGCYTLTASATAELEGWVE